MAIKYQFSDVYDGIITPEQYYAQFETAKLEVGGRYINNVGSFMQTEYEIVYIGHGVALGVEVGKNGKDKYGIGTPNKCLFISEGLQEGWRVGDNRPCFRLRNK